MTQEEWRKEVRKRLIDEDLNISKLAERIGVTRQWIRMTLKGKTNQSMVDKISEELKIKPFKV